MSDIYITRMIAKVNMYVFLKFGLNWTINMADNGKKFISSILVVVNVIFVLLQFEAQYLKNRKRYRSDICTQVGLMTQCAVTCQNVCKQCSLRANNNNAF